MRELVLSANRHRHHGRACEAASREGGAAFSPRGPFAILPLKGNRSSIVWSEDKERGKRSWRPMRRASSPSFHAASASILAPSCSPARVNPFPSIPDCEQLCRRSLRAVGDAAHAVHPLAGQGLNIGMRDVAALAEISSRARGSGRYRRSVLLERYERWRRFDSAFSATVMDGLNRLFSNDNAPLRALAISASAWSIARRS